MEQGIMKTNREKAQRKENMMWHNNLSSSVILLSGRNICQEFIILNFGLVSMMWPKSIIEYLRNSRFYAL